MKHQESSAGSTHSSSDQDLVLTPAGYLKKSNGHRLDNKNFRLSVVDGRLKKVSKATGEIVEDWGDAPTTSSNDKNLPRGPRGEGARRSSVVPYTSGWACYGYLTSQNYETTNPLSYFSTTWYVPGIPAYTGQTLFLFNGVENGGAILQPVLQFGPSAAGGGDYWAITNWYVYNNNQNWIVGDSLVEVESGTAITGVMQLQSQSGSNYTYTSSFVNHPGTDISIPNVAQLNYPTETLEVYNLTETDNYPQPPSVYVGMRSIDITIQGSPGTLTWHAANNFANENEHAIVYSNTPGSSEVDLYWHAAFSNRTNSVDWSYGYSNQSGSITAFPGNQVELLASVTLEPPGTYSVDILLPNTITFTSNTSGSSTDILTASSSLNNTTATFNMPSNTASVSWSGSFTESNNYGSALIDVAD